MNTQYVKTSEKSYDVVVDGKKVGAVKKIRQNVGAYTAPRYGWIPVSLDGRHGKFPYQTREEAAKTFSK